MVLQRKGKAMRGYATAQNRTEYFRTAKVWMRSAKCREGIAENSEVEQRQSGEWMRLAKEWQREASNRDVEQRQSKDAIGYVKFERRFKK